MLPVFLNYKMKSTIHTAIYLGVKVVVVVAALTQRTEVASLSQLEACAAQRQIADKLVHFRCIATLAAQA